MVRKLMALAAALWSAAARSPTVLVADVDGASTALSRRGLRPDWVALLDWARARSGLVVPLAFATGRPTCGFGQFVSFLKRIGFEVFLRSSTDPGGSETAPVGPAMASETLAAVVASGAGRVVLVSGNNDLVPLVLTLRGIGVRVTVVLPGDSTGRALVAVADEVVRLRQIGVRKLNPVRPLRPPSPTPPVPVPQPVADGAVRLLPGINWLSSLIADVGRFLTVRHLAMKVWIRGARVLYRSSWRRLL